MNKNISAIRQDYLLASLQEEDTFDDPILQFHKWFQEAVDSAIDEVNAMTLATVDASHKPHARIVLLKGVEENQFVFFTNYHSHKGQQIGSNAGAALVFFWKELQRQVRIDGVIEKISEKESTDYFHSRPKESQIGAWASHQSAILEKRDDLEARYVALTKKYENEMVPKPPHWGGYALKPTSIEFWQGRASRLHDRILYEIVDANWTKVRLNP
jgi:pyridoxamine 5'-phosphate oxidase